MTHRSKEGLCHVHSEEVEHGNGLITQSHVGSAHALILSQLMKTGLLQLLMQSMEGGGEGAGVDDR